MPVRIKHMNVLNYRSLADLSIETDSINVLFGPNGAGKSTFLDTIWFVRDCAIRGVDLASSTRSHGIGLLWDCANEGDPISITLVTDTVEYKLLLGLSSGRIESYVGERLRSLRRDVPLITREIGSDKASFYFIRPDEHLTVPLREPQKTSLGKYLDFEDSALEVNELDRLLHFVHLYNSRSFLLHRLKQQGSVSSYETWLWELGDNLWSVLRNLQGRQAADNRYDTITRFMAESFPSFDGLLLDPTGPSTVYCSFLEKRRRSPILASGVSDGHLQMLLLLTALFAEGQQRDSLILLDEPEISLHPWALSVFAEAVKVAAREWNKQIFIATHSPVLISQFDPEHIMAAELEDGRTRLTRLTEMEAVKDLLEQYAAGSLYMANVIAGQGRAVSQSDQKDDANVPNC
ncbi:MAG: AAA family ATPase [Syntrophobacteraceae bacterium]|jgi:predicted ATPase